MKSLDPTFIFLCNYAIPSNNILNEGLGDLLVQKRSSEIELLIKELLSKYKDFFLLIKSILADNADVDGFEYSDITNHLISIYGTEKCFPFTKDLGTFCAKAYFSNTKVLDAYSLIITSNQKNDILNKEIDNSIFSKLTNK